MHAQRVLALSSLLLVGKLVLAAELDLDDVPTSCNSACDPTVTLAQRCDRQNNNDTTEMECICNADGSRAQVPHCEACIAQYRQDHPRDDDEDGNDDEDVDDDDDDPHNNGRRDLFVLNLDSCTE
ncbi:hypothetical protein BDW59DRAFT_159997 [Aspergillus cavernicola]|uniref:Uncharacterized protein n=1 Tax=Aspergillus cavernicola TaxID=176166 RepID=A0ABR4ILG5_9EURO